MAGSIFSGWQAVSGAPLARPPSDTSTFGSLGDMIDALTQRRLQIAKMQQEQEAADFDQKMQEERMRREQEQQTLAQRKQDEKDVYFRRKLDLQEQRDKAKTAFERATHNQAQHKEIEKTIGAGRTPGSYIFLDPAGNPIQVTPRYVPRGTPPGISPAPAQPAAPTAPQAPGGADPLEPPPQGQPAYAGAIRQAGLTGLPIPPAMAETVATHPDADSPDEAGLYDRDPNPADTEMRRQQLLRSDPGDNIDLGALDDERESAPEEMAQDPAAVEAQRERMLRQSGDTGGNIDLANPPPVPNYQRLEMSTPEESQQILQQLGVPPLPPKLQQPAGQLPIIEASATEGAQPQAQPAPAGGVWTYEVPGMGTVEIDPGQARQARLAEVQAQLAQLDAAMKDPAIMATPAIMFQLARERALLAADLPEKDRQALVTQGAKADLEHDKLASQEKRAAERNATALEVAKMRARKRMASAEAGVATGNTAYARLGQKLANRTRASVRIDMDSALKRMNWDKLEGVGFDRLNLAQLNASATGPFAGTQHMEALMNFFGYIRGGVPALNETREWHRTTSSLQNAIDSAGAYFGIQDLGKRLFSGDTQAEDEFEKIASDTRMPYAQRESLKRAIGESMKFVRAAGEKNLDAFAESYRETSTLPERELAQARLNALRSFLGLGTKQFFGDVPLRGGKAPEQPAAGAAPTPAAPAPAAGQPAAPTGGRQSIRDLLMGGG